MKTDRKIIVYQGKNGSIELNTDAHQNTIWATQAQIAQIFGITPQNITLHLKNIYKEEELSEKATCKDFLQVQKEGSRTIQRKQKFYNLDAIISVGYRINSIAGTKFRQWATKTLRTHIVEGYTINKSRIVKNYDTFLKAVEVDHREIFNHHHRRHGKKAGHRSPAGHQIRLPHQPPQSESNTLYTFDVHARHQTRNPNSGAHWRKCLYDFGYRRMVFARRHIFQPTTDPKYLP